ncbi:MAG: caspase family protein [Bacteroidota bacterium]
MRTADNSQVTLSNGKTYALIVGISKYKDPGIHALEYADKDAESFYQYLKAENVDSANMVLLLNEKATSAQFWSSLLYLVELSKQGDKVLVYFSGHGDVETKTAIPEGYLLPYDVPRAGYMPFAIPITILKNYVSGMSVKGVQIIFITDACHSGNLAGGLAGMEATANLLKDKWKDEIKMLSCQPKELSLEGKQWGGGRGLFSYELINGLAGKADKNKDGKVTLRELNLYLMEKVPEGASPAIQNPEIEGSPEYVISKVNEKLLKEISKDKISDKIEAIAMRGDESSLLNELSADIRENYTLFKSSFDAGNYAEYPDEQIEKYFYSQSKDSMTLQASALYYLQKIPVNESTHILVSLMRRNLSSAIMEDMSSNAYENTSTDSVERKASRVRKWEHEMASSRYSTSTQKVSAFLKYTEQNALCLQELIGDQKMKEMGYYSKYILSLSMWNILSSKNQEREVVLRLIDTAIHYDSLNANLYIAKADIYLFKSQLSVAEAYCRKAIAVSPTFGGAYIESAAVYHTMQKYDSCKFFALSGIHYSLGNRQNTFRAKLLYFMAAGMIEIDSLKLEHVSDSMKNLCNEFDNILRIQDWDSSLYYTFTLLLGQKCIYFRMYEKALYWLNKCDDKMANSMTMMSEKYFYESVANNALGNKDKSLADFKLALENGFKRYYSIIYANELDNIRKEPEYVELMKKYFPNKYKE